MKQRLHRELCRLLGKKTSPVRELGVLALIASRSSSVLRSFAPAEELTIIQHPGAPGREGTIATLQRPTSRPQQHVDAFEVESVDEMAFGGRASGSGTFQ
jgi:hypothetical protein